MKGRGAICGGAAGKDERSGSPAEGAPTVLLHGPSRGPAQRFEGNSVLGYASTNRASSVIAVAERRRRVIDSQFFDYLNIFARTADNTAAKPFKQLGEDPVAYVR